MDDIPLSISVVCNTGSLLKNLRYQNRLLITETSQKNQYKAKENAPVHSKTEKTRLNGQGISVIKKKQIWDKENLFRKYIV